MEQIKKIIRKLRSTCRKIKSLFLLAIMKYMTKKRHKQKKMIIAVEFQTTNEFFYLKPVLTSLHEEGHLLFFTVREKLEKAIRELAGSSFPEKPPLLLDVWITPKIPTIDFYLNATLSYDIQVPEKARYKISFPHSITSKTKYDVFSPAIEKITDMFVTGEVFLNDLKTYCKDHGIKNMPRLHKIGCPKSDVIFGLSMDKKDFLKSNGLDPELPALFHAPTWNPDTSVFTWRDDILSVTERHKVNMIVKIHPGAYIDPNNVKSSGGIDWKSFFESDNLKKKRIVNAYHTDSPEYIMASDIAITDISTIWIECYFLKKPIIFLDIPKFFESHQKNSLGDFRDDYGYLVKSAEELDKIIDGLLKGKIPPRDPPPIKDMLLYNQGVATEKTIEKMTELLKI